MSPGTWRSRRSGSERRIFERGVGETSASGTGATGAAVAHVLAGGRSPVSVLLDGGELEVEVGAELQIGLKGWAVPVFKGTLAPEFVKELHATRVDVWTRSRRICSRSWSARSPPSAPRGST